MRVEEMPVRIQSEPVRVQVPVRDSVSEVPVPSFSQSRCENRCQSEFQSAGGNLDAGLRSIGHWPESGHRPEHWLRPGPRAS